uniref:MROH2B-like HEAT-repeats domain-containing protein n=1 Tax=Molossus molossus TaxID=27622 RepID=A0A7J8FZU2_MOLMO|nr:hypothetical protein HJG59_008277 [Molossus molossus]
MLAGKELAAWPQLRGRNECIYQFVTALAVNDCGGRNLESQLENISGMLFDQLSKEVNQSGPYSGENFSFTMKAFFILTRLYKDQLIFLIRKTMESSDTAKIVSALQVFRNVFQEVPQTEKMKREVMHSTIMVIQEDFIPVSRKAACSGWEAIAVLRNGEGKVWGDEERGEAPFQASSGLRLQPMVMLGLFKTRERFEKWTGGSFIFSEPFLWAALW